MPEDTVVEVVTRQLVVSLAGIPATRVDALADQISRLVAECQAAAEQDADVAVWTESAYLAIISALIDSGHGRYALVIGKAAFNGGYIGRDEVYELCNFDSQRSLKGFTRPVRAAQTALIRTGVLHPAAGPALDPAYDPAKTGFHKARGFRVPPEFVGLAQGIKAKRAVEAAESAA